MSALKIKNALNQWEEVPMLKGDTGDSGVHIGAEAPTDENKNVWIDIDDDNTLVFPTITSEDDGKVLTVANGQWALGNGGSSGGGNIGTGNFIIPFHSIYNQETQQVEVTCETTWTEFINAYKSGLVIEFRNIINIYNSEDTYYVPFRLSNVMPRNNLDTSVFLFINLNSIYPSGWTWYELQVEKDTNSTEDAISFEILTHQVTHQVNDNV